ncbi:MAG: dihydropteroate synthase [Campylobacteraceae bacterium]|jgi:dihydropteroate synthase|nr:dihydropteroate synthase [Campylobacteraceae bacterium]
MKTKIMAVLNINSDSFFKESRITTDEAEQKIIQTINDGADIIDIGALSSRPGSETISDEEELKRVKKTLDMIKQQKFYEKAVFSLDSYSPLTLDYALNCGFKIVNDITGLQDAEVCKIAKKYSATVCIMHMKGEPKNMQANPEYSDIVKEVDDFFKERIERAKSFGIDNIILDAGIGFGKKLEHNIALIKHYNYFTHFGYPLLVGASRKSMISDISHSSIENRLPGTLAVHLEAVRNGAAIVRCHDVKEHVQALKVFEALQ